MFTDIPKGFDCQLRKIGIIWYIVFRTLNISILEIILGRLILNEIDGARFGKVNAFDSEICYVEVFKNLHKKSNAAIITLHCLCRNMSAIIHSPLMPIPLSSETMPICMK